MDMSMSIRDPSPNAEISGVPSMDGEGYTLNLDGSDLGCEISSSGAMNLNLASMD